MENASLLAQVFLGFSVPIIIGLFFAMKPQKAVLIAALGAEMFLPESTVFKFPMMPPLDKHNLPYVCILIGCLLRCPRRVTKLPKDKWVIVLTLLLVVGCVLTAMTNRDIIERRFLKSIPNMNLNDGIFMAVNNFSRIALPFFIGCSIFKTSADLRLLLMSFSVGAVVYIPFELWEIRMSPNINYKLYGFFQDDFNETRRWGGFRPLVFMKHGLALARFAVCGTLAPFVFGRARAFFGVPWNLWRWVLLVVLILCKSTGAALYVMIALPLLLWPKAKRSARIAAIIGAVVFLYPVLRLTEVFPVQGLLQASNALVGADRTQSVEFRFQNEDKLVAKGRERALFGWGQYGRNFTFDQYGHSSIADGYWIIEFGEKGAAGYVVSFGFVLFPIFLVWWRLNKIPDPNDRVLIAGATMILAIVSLDLLPNGMWGFYPYLIAGALTGVCREMLLGHPTPAYARPSHVGEMRPPQQAVG